MLKVEAPAFGAALPEAEKAEIDPCLHLVPDCTATATRVSDAGMHTPRRSRAFETVIQRSVFSHLPSLWLALAIGVSFCDAFSVASVQRRMPVASALAAGRGHDHLSASLEEGDLVCYQSGSWFVDGVVVGNGGEPELSFAFVTLVQLVFTHNCEHGWIYGVVADVDGEAVYEREEEVQIGPEQLVARLDLEDGRLARGVVEIVEGARASLDARA